MGTLVPFLIILRGGNSMAVKESINIVVNNEEEFNNVISALNSKKSPSDKLKCRVAKLKDIKVVEDIFVESNN